MVCESLSLAGTFKHIWLKMPAYTGFCEIRTLTDQPRPIYVPTVGLRLSGRLDVSMRKEPSDFAHFSAKLLLKLPVIREMQVKEDGSMVFLVEHAQRAAGATDLQKLRKQTRGHHQAPDACRQEREFGVAAKHGSADVL